MIQQITRTAGATGSGSGGPRRTGRCSEVGTAATNSPALNGGKASLGNLVGLKSLLRSRSAAARAGAAPAPLKVGMGSSGGSDSYTVARILGSEEGAAQAADASTLNGQQAATLTTAATPDSNVKTAVSVLGGRENILIASSN